MNAGELATLRTDFNAVDDDGLLTATNTLSGGFSSELRNGAMVYVADGEGNSCIAWIMRKKGPLFYLRPEWSSWVSTELVAVTGGQVVPALTPIMSKDQVPQSAATGFIPARS